MIITKKTYQRLNHPKVREQSFEFKRDIYPTALLNKMNISFNGGKKLHRQYNTIIDQLVKLTGDADSRQSVKLFLYHFLICKIHQNTKQFVVTLNPNYFQAANKEVANAPVYSTWVNTLETLVMYGYGDLYIGDGQNEEDLPEWENRGNRYKSIFVCNEKLIDLISNTNNSLAPSQKQPLDKVNAVVFAEKYYGSGGKLKETIIEGVRGSRPYKANVNSLNEFMRGFDIHTGEGVRLLDTDLQRKFTRRKGRKAEWFAEAHGRFFANYQIFSQEQRSLLIIAGEPVCELDYGSNHARICYQIEGIDLEPDFRPYAISNYDSPLKGTAEAKRQVYKTAMMLMFNMKKPAKKLYEIIDDAFSLLDEHLPHELPPKISILAGLYKQPTFVECEEIIRLIILENKPIKQYFCGGMSGKLQKIDSDIAEHIMLNLMQQNIPFLCFHDSFIVPSSKKHQLKQAMFDGWKAILGSNSCCTIDQKYDKGFVYQEPLEEIQDEQDFNEFLQEIGHEEESKSDIWMETTEEHDRRLFVNGSIQNLYDWKELAEIWQKSGRTLTPLMIHNRDNIPIPF